MMDPELKKLYRMLLSGKWKVNYVLKERDTGHYRVCLVESFTYWCEHWDDVDIRYVYLKPRSKNGS